MSEFDRLVVVLEGGAPHAKPPETVVIDQRNMRFDPDLVVIPTGSTVQFPNSDPIFHNIFSLSKTQPFDLGIYPQRQSRTVKIQPQWDSAGVLSHPRQHVRGYCGDVESLVCEAGGGWKFLMEQRSGRPLPAHRLAQDCWP